MNEENKKGFRWWLFNKLGPPEVQNLIKYIDQIWEQTGSNAICIYPAGEFKFAVKTSVEGDHEPMIFPTPQERTAYQSGLAHGVHLMGGQSNPLDEDEWDALEKMEKISTHSGGSGRNN